jgi:hypothetical protein
MLVLQPSQIQGKSLSSLAFLWAIGTIQLIKSNYHLSLSGPAVNIHLQSRPAKYTNHNQQEGLPYFEGHGTEPPSDDLRDPLGPTVKKAIGSCFACKQANLICGMFSHMVAILLKVSYTICKRPLCIPSVVLDLQIFRY